MKLREAIQRLAGTWGKANFRTFDATVETVDIATRTCVVNSLDSSILGLTVRFMLEVSDGDMSVPQEESTVSVAMTDFTEPYIVSSTWLKDKLFIVGNQSYEIIDGKQIFNDGKYGGLAIVKSLEGNSESGLLKKINDLENKLNDLISKFNSHTHILAIAAAAGVGGTGTAAPTVTSETPIIPLTSESDISNPNITHGDKF